MLNYFLVGLGGFSLVGMIVFLAFQRGKSLTKLEQAEEVNKSVQENIKIADENEKTVSNMDSDDRSKLRSEFSKKRL